MAAARARRARFLPPDGPPMTLKRELLSAQRPKTAVSIRDLVGAAGAACALFAACTEVEPGATAPSGAATQGDVSTPDALPSTGGDLAAAYQCPGGHGCPCSADGECAQSGLCLGDVDGARACALPCPTGACGAGQVCRAIGDGKAPGPYCVAKAARTCDPCAASADCAIRGHEGAACVDYGAAGRFCGVACQGASDCATGEACRTVASVDRGAVRQCVKVDGEALGVCSCSPRATAKKLGTACGVGTCVGQRACGDGGLSACDAKAPATEACNGSDDDCDGLTDEAVGGTPLCADGNPCTTDACDPKSGCSNLPADGAPCDADGSACTGPDLCAAGACKAGAKLACDDQNPCTTDSCSAATGCVFAAAPGKACDDGDSCTANDACSAGACAGKPKVCDDANPCTADVCLAGACTGTAVDGAPCSDGNPCSGPDACKGGSCSGAKATCDDANPCTSDTCDPKSGCANLPLGATACDDGNPCTLGEACDAGSCGGGAVATCPSPGACLVGVCAPATGACAIKLAGDGAACDDGKACTAADTCTKGACNGKTSCDDGDSCTVDSCTVDGACAHSATSAGCDDGDKCTTGDSCKSGACKGATTPGACDDNNPCTTDGCDAKTGCTHNPVGDGTPCDDGLACSGADSCKGGKCDQHAAACKTCAKDAECASEDDGNACNGKVVCSSGTCALDPQSVVVCDPAKDTACTVNTCDPSSGTCAPSTLPDGATCSDGDGCTKDDVCAAGACAGAGGCNDGNACTKDTCSGTLCSNAPLAGGSCSDGNLCTGGDSCAVDGACAGTPKACDDANPCTVDACDAKTGACVAPAAADATPCDDGNACTSADGCAAGTCKGKAKVCDDSNPCTADACDANTGACSAQPAADATPCDDGDPCTEGDKCAAGACKGAIGADTVTTIAGNGVAGFKNGTGTQTQFAEPVAIVVGPDGDLYVADAAEGAARVRRISTTGVVSTHAGQGISGFADGGPNDARFWRPSALAFASDGKLYVADRYNQRVRLVAADGTVATLAGHADEPGFGATKATGGFADGKGAAAQFDEPAGIAWSATDSALYVVEAVNQRVRKIALDGTVSTVAGTGSTGDSDGDAATATFSGPTAIACGDDGTLYIADTGNHRVRTLAAGKVATLAGLGPGFKDGPKAGAQFVAPAGLSWLGTSLYVADTENSTLRAIGAADVSTLAGTGTAGFADGEFLKAQFSKPRGVVAASAGLWYVADTGGARVRKLSSPALACKK